MCVYKQGEKWWYEFDFRGQRVRASSRSTDKAVALLIEAEHRRSLELGTGGTAPTLEAIKAKEKAERVALPPARIFQPTGEAQNGVSPLLPKQENRPTQRYTAEPAVTPGMSIREAGEIWLAAKRDWKRRKPKTLECSTNYLRALLRFFGDTQLREIQPRSILAYQATRSKQVGASSVNHEVNALSQILKRCGLWSPIRDYYSPLPEPVWKAPKVYTLEEQRQIFNSAKGDPNLELAELVFTITRNTSASGCELRLSRLDSVDLTSPRPVFRVTGDVTKNDIRPRIIPLTADALEAFRRAVERAAKLGSHLPGHYLFPFRVNKAKWDPTRPASKSWLRKQTERLRERTGIKHIKPHTWRHQLCTEMLEQGVPEETVKGVMGWCSRRMIATYSHTRLAAKADALSLLENVSHKATEVPARPRRIARHITAANVIAFPGQRSAQR
jgi:integrase